MFKIDINTDKKLNLLARERDNTLFNLEQAVKDLSTAYVSSVDNLDAKLKGFNANLFDDFIDSIKNQKRDESVNEVTFEKNKKETLLLWSNLKKIVIDPFLAQGAKIISLDPAFQRVVLARFPGLVNTDLISIIDHTSLIFIDYYGNVNTVSISIPLFYGLIDLAANDTTNHLDIRKMLMRTLDKDELKLGKAQNSIFVRSAIDKENYQLISRKSLNENDKTSSGRYQSIQLLKFNDITHYNGKEFNPELTTMTARTYLIDTENDTLFAADSFSFNKQTAQAFLGYIEFLNNAFNTKKIFEECKKVETKGLN